MADHPKRQPTTSFLLLMHAALNAASALQTTALTPPSLVEQTPTSTINVGWVALGPDKYIDATAPIIQSIERRQQQQQQQREVAPLTQYYLFVGGVDGTPAAKSIASARDAMLSRHAWQGMQEVVESRLHLKDISTVPQEAKELHRRLSSTATGPAAIYLWKPLLHLALPEVDRLVVLDCDVFLLGDIGPMFRIFEAFAPTAMLGLAAEQAPTYLDVKEQGGFGLNGGVQLLHLERMRASPIYARLLEGYAAGVMPMRAGGIGWLGDQTLYSYMSVNSTGAVEAGLFHLLDCGWNWQTGTFMASSAGFWQAHSCSSRCNLLHGNRVEHKSLIAALHAAEAEEEAEEASTAHGLTARACSATVTKFTTTKEWSHVGDLQMLKAVDKICCGGTP